jgi:hypothetical protein
MLKIFFTANSSPAYRALGGTGFLFWGCLGSQASTEVFFNYAKVCYFLGCVFHVFNGKMNEK